MLLRPGVTVDEEEDMKWPSSLNKTWIFACRSLLYECENVPQCRSNRSSSHWGGGVVHGILLITESYSTVGLINQTAVVKPAEVADGGRRLGA